MRASRCAALAAITLLTAVALTGCGIAGSGGSSTTQANSPDYEKGYRLGREAYTYGLPLITTDATYRTMTSPNVSVGAYGPVNRFNNVSGTNNANSDAVVAPGSTSLSSIAWLDLSTEPQVMHVPKVTSNFFVLAFIDPYTTNVENFGPAENTEPGDYVIAGPGQGDTTIPAGTTRVDVDYPRIWVIGSTQLKGQSDVAAVNKIQAQYTITPLSRYGTEYTPPAPSKPDTTVVQATVPTGLAFFDAIGRQLAAFPPPAADKAELARLAEVGIGPGMSPSSDSRLSSDTVRGLTDAVAAGPAQIQKDVKELFAKDFGEHNGYLLGGFGSYGTDYKLRAVISQIGLGAFVPQQAIYAMSWSDHGKKTLSGDTPYVLHLKEAPPTQQGWSLTVYNLKGALVSNPLNRYAFTNISPLAKNADGSIDLYLQSTEPTDAAKVANWLPTPAGQGFEVTWRLFAPNADKIDGILDGTGWQPPAIQPEK